MWSEKILPHHSLCPPWGLTTRIMNELRRQEFDDLRSNLINYYYFGLAEDFNKFFFTDSFSSEQSC